MIQRLYEALEPGGYLFLGHADSHRNAGVKLDTIVHGDVRIYQKPLTHARLRQHESRRGESLSSAGPE